MTQWDKHTCCFGLLVFVKACIDIHMMPHSPAIINKLFKKMLIAPWVNIWWRVIFMMSVSSVIHSFNLQNSSVNKHIYNLEIRN